MAEPGEPGIRTMHPAPSLGEAPPAGFPRQRLDYDLQALVADVQSPPPGNNDNGFEVREPERFSIHGPDESAHLLPPPNSTAAASAHLMSNRLSSVEMTTTPSTIIRPQALLRSQSEYVVHDGSDQPDQPDDRRTPKGARRRTGPLNQEQRMKAAIIRKIGACQDCRRRRVSCDPSRVLPFLFSPRTPDLFTSLPLTAVSPSRLLFH